MARFEWTLAVQRPVEQVFAFLTNGENNHKWELEIVDSRQLTEGPTRVGTKWLHVRQFAGIKLKTISEIVEYEPNRKWATRGAMGPMPVTETIIFEPADGGTKLQMILNIQTVGLLRLIDPLLKNMLRRLAQINIRKLKELLEIM